MSVILQGELLLINGVDTLFQGYCCAECSVFVVLEASQVFWDKTEHRHVIKACNESTCERDKLK